MERAGLRAHVRGARAVRICYQVVLLARGGCSVFIYLITLNSGAGGVWPANRSPSARPLIFDFGVVILKHVKRGDATQHASVQHANVQRSNRERAKRERRPDERPLHAPGSRSHPSRPVQSSESDAQREREKARAQDSGGTRPCKQSQLRGAGKRCSSRAPQDTSHPSP